MNINELLIREQVRDTMARYTRAGDGGKIDELVQQFTEDGVIEFSRGHKGVGHAGIREKLMATSSIRPPIAMPDQKPIVRHFTSNTQFISITDKQVKCTTYFQAWTAVGSDHWGRYFDVLVPAGDLWLFKHRFAKVEGYKIDGWYQENVQDSHA